jgi:hypothetical protein
MRGASSKVRRITMPAAALAAAAITAGAALPASASTATSSAIRPVTCRSTTFNVFYGNGREICYEGTGQIMTHIGPVSRISTGENTGSFELTVHGTSFVFVYFNPGLIVGYPQGDQAELVMIDITGA